MKMILSGALALSLLAGGAFAQDGYHHGYHHHHFRLFHHHHRHYR